MTVFNISYLSQIWFFFWGGGGEYLGSIYFLCMSLLFRSSWINLVLYLNKKFIILCFHSFNKNGQKKRKLFPFSCFVCFISATPYTQVLHNVVNFPVSNTFSAQFTKFRPLSFHLHVPLQKIQNRKPIFPFQKLKRTLLFYQETIASLTI